jgi:Protein kinase domain
MLISANKLSSIPKNQSHLHPTHTMTGQPEQRERVSSSRRQNPKQSRSHSPTRERSSLRKERSVRGEQSLRAERSAPKRDSSFRRSSAFCPHDFIRKHSTRRPFEKYYTFGPLLGEGGFGSAYVCTHKATGADRAVKVLPKSNEEARKEAYQEFRIMSKMDHPVSSYVLGGIG